MFECWHLFHFLSDLSKLEPHLENVVRGGHETEFLFQIGYGLTVVVQLFDACIASYR